LDVESFVRGRDGLEYLRRNLADLVLLDVMLPDETGLISASAYAPTSG